MGRKYNRNKSCPLKFLQAIRLCRMPEPDSPRIPTKLDDQLEVLDTFVESADELVASKYIEQLQDNGVSSKRQWTPNSLTVTTTSPDHEAAKAVILTLRMFCQNNDATSFENIATMLTCMTSDPTALANFQKSRANFNTYLNSPPSITFPSCANAHTRRQIWDTFLYGMFAHADIGKRRTIKNWQAQPYANDIRMQFDLITLQFIKAVTIMAKACKSIADSNRPPAS